ncbi:MAG: glycosyltransferase family 4 protein [Solirubrobacterales bacterium]
MSVAAHRTLRVALDARPLDIDFLRSQGIGRVADALIEHLVPVAAERGGELVLLRQDPGPGPTGLARSRDVAAGARTMRLRRPPVPARLADLPEQVLLPWDIRRSGAAVSHALSIYRSAAWVGRPQVVTVHDVIPLMWPQDYLRTGIVHRLLYRTLRRADALIAVSEQARSDVISTLGVDPRKIEVIHNAHSPHFRPSDPTDTLARRGIAAPYLLYVGGLTNDDPRKNVGSLIDAFAQWSRERDRPETLVLAGRLGPAAEPLITRAERTGGRIRFTGFVDDAELPALLTGARCLVTSSRYEGFGLPALEALACGTPVAGFDAGAIREVAGPGAELVQVGDVAALLGAVERICDDPGHRAKLADQGLRHAAGFSWRRNAERTWDVYERLAGAR